MGKRIRNVATAQVVAEYADSLGESVQRVEGASKAEAVRLSLYVSGLLDTQVAVTVAEHTWSVPALLAKVSSEVVEARAALAEGGAK